MNNIIKEIQKILPLIKSIPPLKDITVIIVAFIGLLYYKPLNDPEIIWIIILLFIAIALWMVVFLKEDKA